MIRKKLITLIIGLGFISTASVYAEGIGVFGSYWDPADGDQTLGVGVRARGGAGPVYFEVRGTFFEDITEDNAFFHNNLQVIPIDVGIGLQLQVTDLLEIYGGGGVTYYFVDSDYGKVDNEVGYYLQAGTELAVNEGFGVFAEAVWRRVEASLGNENQVEDSKVDLKGMSVNLGLVFRW